MTGTIAALVGSAGGVGTSRLTVECGATLARAGWTVALFDASFATPGLDRYVPGSIQPDLTSLLTGGCQLQDALYDSELDVPGRLAICPASAPFARRSTAMTADAARQFEQQLASSSLTFDAVLVDTPPVAGNQALAAVNAAERVAVVTEDSTRGLDALASTRDVLADVGVSPTMTVANRAGDGEVAADVSIPDAALGPARNGPECLSPDEAFAPAIGETVEQLYGVSLDLEYSGGGRLGGLLGRS